MFSKWRHRDLHSLRKVTQLATGPRLQIQESGANVWAPDSSLHHDKTSPGAHPRAEPQAGSTAACSLLVSLHGWPAPQPPCIVSERLLECGASVHLLRPVLLTAFLCPFELSVLAWRIPGTGSLAGCRLWGRTELDMTEVT